MSIVFDLTAPDSSIREESGAAGRAMLSWFSAIARAVAAGVLAVVGGLVVWSVLPTALGWKSHVIVSGSMQPRIMPGDVVLTQPVGDLKLQPGFVVVFHDPSNPGRQLVHRVSSVRADGSVVTKGDSNRIVDGKPVPRADILGLARLRVPYVGLPLFWRAQGASSHAILATLAILGAAVFVARDASGDDTDDTDESDDESDDVEPLPSGELLPEPAPTAA